MAANYGYNTGMPVSYQPNAFFLQPHGNVYLIGSSLEVANVPMNSGLSVALCLNEGLMYVKSMQNGTPNFMVYSIAPYEKKDNNTQSSVDHKSSEDFLLSKIGAMEKRLEELGGKLNELLQ